ncbi:MAG: HlyD family efflux transporter periplasmic adaptor subunit [Cyanobacteria bacterium J06639_18]
MSRLGESPRQNEESLGKSKLWWVIALTLPIVVAAGILATAKVEQLRTMTGVSVTPTAPATISVNAIGRLEPTGKVIKLSAPSSGLEAVSRVDRVLVREGQSIEKGETIAILDNLSTNQAVLSEARAKLQESRANLVSIRTVSPRDIEAQIAVVNRLRAQLGAERNAQQATVTRLQVELQGERLVQQATVERLAVELEGQRNALTATVARILAEQRNAQVELGRYQNLYREGAISRQDFERTRLTAVTATQQLAETRANRTQIIASLRQQLVQARANQAKTVAIIREQLAEARAIRAKTIASLQNQINEETAKFNRIRDVSPLDIQVAQAQVNNAIAAVRRAEAGVKLSYIKTPISGEVLQINTRPGESIGTESIAEVGRTEQMTAVAEVPEGSINKVRVGQKVSISSDNGSFNGQLQGRVTEIGRQVGKRDVLSTDPAADVDARVVEVKIALSENDSKKVAGLTNSKVVVEIFI